MQETVMEHEIALNLSHEQEDRNLQGKIAPLPCHVMHLDLLSLILAESGLVRTVFP